MIVAGGFAFEPEDPDEFDQTGHGTCVAAMALDSELGVAKKATLVPVYLRHDMRTIAGAQGPLFSSLLTGFEKVHQDIRDKGRQGKAVINFSISCKYLRIP
jgi:hypothetical protein